VTQPARLESKSYYMLLRSTPLRRSSSVRRISLQPLAMSARLRSSWISDAWICHAGIGRARTWSRCRSQCRPLPSPSTPPTSHVHGECRVRFFTQKQRVQAAGLEGLAVRRRASGTAPAVGDAQAPAHCRCRRRVTSWRGGTPGAYGPVCHVTMLHRHHGLVIHR
jgi:hypothetical protein